MESDVVPVLPGYRLEALVGGLAPSTGRAGDPTIEATVHLSSDRPRVWRATRVADQRSVAIKVFPARQAGLARREAALLSAVDHPHLLALIEVVGTAEHVGLVSAFADGGSLAALLVRRGRLTWPEALTVLIPLADALAAADEQELVHGDVSAGNVLFGAGGRPVLADLGAARAAAELSLPVAVTPTDVAPEVARGSVPDHRSDLFSLGSVALQCLSGRPAWPADTITDALIQSTLGQWPDPDCVIAPDGLLAIVRRLLDPEPGRRGSAAALAIDLRRVGQPAPVELSETTTDGQPRLPATQVRPDAVALHAAAAAVAARRPHGRLLGRRRLGLRRIRDRPRRDDSVVGDRAREPGGRHAAGRSRQPAAAGPGPHPSRIDAGRLPQSHVKATLVGVIAVLALGIGAVRIGLWWAGSGRVDPSTVAAAPVSSSAAGPATSGAAPGTSPSAESVSGSSQPVPASREEWTAVVAALDADRARALTQQDPALLDLVYAPGSPALAADVATIQQLRTSGYRLAGAGHEISSVVVLPDRTGPASAAASAGPSWTDHTTTALRVVEAMPSTMILGADGRVLGRTDGSAASAIVLFLVNTDDGFRIRSIQPG